MTQFELRRLAYIIRKTVEWDLGPAGAGVRLEAVAEEIGHGFAAYLKALVWGKQHTRTVEIDAPDGRWQCLLAGLGLPYRRRKVILHLSMLFPALDKVPEGGVTALEWDVRRPATDRPATLPS